MVTLLLRSSERQQRPTLELGDLTEDRLLVTSAPHWDSEGSLCVLPHPMSIPMSKPLVF